MENIKAIKKYNIFRGLEETEISALLRCFNARSVTIPKNTIFIRRGERIIYFYIIISGFASFNSVDINGNPVSSLELSEGDIIGINSYMNGKRSFQNEMIAKTEIKALLVDAFRFVTPCQNFCPRHTKVLINALNSTTKKNIMFAERIKSLSHSKTRDKILSYFNEQIVSKKSNEFDIPYTHQELANILGVERSALSKELSDMQKEGIITYHQKHYIVNN